ncbi:hypothetical protein QFZ32_000548 [Streptomyces canus]|nr:hypothetical protein [Streptomyces canus]MDQ1065109.1 hypothetical protein [Streptomyces canus]
MHGTFVRTGILAQSVNFAVYVRADLMKRFAANAPLKAPKMVGPLRDLDHAEAKVIWHRATNEAWATESVLGLSWS